MNLKIIFELEARVELIKISEYYRDKSPDLVLRFQAVLEVCFENIRLFPEAFKVVKFGVRRIHLEDFPYIVYYMVDPDAIFIYAIAHNRQDQDYWHHRVSGSQQDS